MDVDSLALGRRTALPILVAAAVMLAGCSTGGHERGADSAEVGITERDFKITAPRRPVRAGKVTLSILNKGPEVHELLVLRKRRSGLPLRKDGVTVDEKALEKSTVKILEAQTPGTHRLRVHLAPGRYELICNMSGHYLGGMEADLVAQ